MIHNYGSCVSFRTRRRFAESDSPSSPSPTRRHQSDRHRVHAIGRMHPAPIDRGVHMRALVADCMASAKVGVTPARWLSILCAEALGHKHSAISHVVMEIAAEGGRQRVRACAHQRQDESVATTDISVCIACSWVGPDTNLKLPKKWSKR